MKLSDRLKKANAKQRERSRSPSPERGVIFLYSAIRDFLESHPLLIHLELCSFDVHGAILQVHDFVQNPVVEEEAEKRNPQLFMNRNNCRECCGYLEVDHHEGTSVCVSCGLVQDLSSINVEPEFTQPPQVSQAFTFSRPDVRGVPKWMLIRKENENEDNVQSSLWSKLEHWNQFVHLSSDDLVKMDCVLKRWHGPGVSNDLRLAGVLLYIPVSRKFINIESVRNRVRRGQSFDRISSITPDPEHACLACGKLCFTARSARYHCKAYGVGRSS